jgi:hypothetical protein
LTGARRAPIVDVVKTLLAVTLLIALGGPGTASAELARPYVERVHIDTPCPVGGGTCAPSPDIYLDEGATPFMLWHERGHLFDAQVMTDAHRDWFMRLMRVTGPWYQGTGAGTAGPSEVFADAYAACATGKRPNVARGKGFRISSWTTSYGWSPGLRQHTRMCNAIALLTHYASGSSK